MNDWLQPSALAAAMMEAGTKKARLNKGVILLTGGLSGMMLGFTTTLFVSALVATDNSVVAALFFPVGFIMLVLLGLELFTGNAALLPYAMLAKRLSFGEVLSALITVYIGNLLGSLLYAVIFAAANTHLFADAPDAVGAKIAAIAGLKTLAYAKLGAAGWGTAFLKGILCNWMVSLGAVMAMVTRSTIGKIVAMFLPIMAFVAQGFEHCVVNMFVIPCGMLLGAPVSISQWWIWNEIPVTLGNIVGAGLFTAAGLYFAFGRTAREDIPDAVPAE
ncbi:formate/nitrite transporter family protein [Acidocella sp. KAb 2-4]|uniref:formate/nitrite transporter family protein n=1 Tax=Acidocella sp. KAb 2-4 TaxID=2885158 RepID=UPI001D08DEB2|nr:formate/nitrite transporter family protein [Acidocella sp. KAb 2-4]MCB5944434.1 formate/nitrite transporter family protein [Acidocella sp. KAb 2-4]